MKFRFTLILPVILILAGCSETPETVQRKPDENSDSPSAAARLQQIRDAEKFAEDLTELNRLAKENEAKLNFADAATIWGQIQQLVSGQFGDESWQAFNARLAHNSAWKKSKFSVDQLDQLKQTERLILEISSLVENKNFQQALTKGEIFVAESKQLFGSDSVEVAQALAQQATVENQLEQYDNAARHFHEAIELFRKHNFKDHPETKTAHSGLANAYLRQSKFTPAAANQKEATRMAGVIWGRQSLEFAKEANQLGTIYHRAGNLEVAFEILDNVLKIRQEELGTDHVLYAHSCLNMGILMLDLKRPDNAEKLLEKALTIFDRDFGTEQALTNQTKSHLATVYMLQTKVEKAEVLLKNIVDSTPANTATHLKHSYRLAIAYARQGKYPVAKPLMEKVIQQQKELYGQNDSRTVESLKAYAMLLERTHQVDAAKTIRQHINRIAQQVDSSDFPRRY